MCLIQQSIWCKNEESSFFSPKKRTILAVKSWSDSRLKNVLRGFVWISYKYVLTIFRTFLLVALEPGFRSGNQIPRTIFPGKRSAEQSRTLSRGKSCLIEVVPDENGWFDLLPVGSKRQFQEPRVLCKTRFVVCTVCSSLRCMNKTVLRERLSPILQ